MSILIAVKKGDTIFFGADTRGRVNGRVRNFLHEWDFKVQKTAEGMVVGMVGDDNVRKTLFACNEIFDLDKKGRLTRKHIINEIIPKIRYILKEEGFVKKEKGVLKEMECRFILAYKGDFFRILMSYDVNTGSDFFVTGRASAFAEYAVSCIKPDDDVNQKIVEALDIVSKHSRVVSRPYVLIDTKDLEYKIVGGEDKC